MHNSLLKGLIPLLTIRAGCDRMTADSMSEDWIMDDYKRMRQRTAGAILTEHEVARIKLNIKQGLPLREMAQAYGVALDTIRRIARGDSWAWVLAEDENELVPAETPESAQAAADSQARFMAKMAAEGLVPTAGEAVVNRLLTEASNLKAKTSTTERQLDELINAPSKR